MSDVSVPIEANPTNAVSAINAIRQATRDATKDNRELAAELEKVNKQFDQLQKVNQGLKARVKATGQSGVPFADMDWERLYDDPRTAARARTQATQYVTQGTQWQTAPQGPVPAGGAPEEGGGRSGLLALGGRLLGPLAAALTVAKVVGKSINYAGGGEHSAETQAIETDELMRSLGGTSESFEEFRKKIREVGDDIGLTSSEAISLAKEFSHLTGLANVDVIRKQTGEAATFGRAFGMDPAASVQQFGRSQFLLGAKSDQREFARLIAESIAASGMWSKGDEVMASIGRFVESSARNMTAAPNIEAFAELSSKLNASGLPSMRGEAGEQLLSQADAGIRGQQNPYALAMFERALNPDRKLDVFQMKMLREGGAFASPMQLFGSGSGETNIERLSAQLKGEAKNPYERAVAAGETFGIPSLKALDLEKLIEQEGGFGGIRKLLEPVGLNIAKVPMESLPGLGQLSRESDAGLLAFRDRFLADHPKLSVFHSNRLQMPSLENDPAELRKSLVQAITSPEAGLSRTAGGDTRQSLADAERAKTDFGESLLTPATALRDATTTFSGGVNSFVDAVKELSTSIRDGRGFTGAGPEVRPARGR